MPDVSVILTTYDRPQALACTLEGYRRQSFEDFEIVIGDDGSGGETAQVIAFYKTLIRQPIHHVWHEHIEHGRTRTINAAVRSSSGQYLVFSDGDCVPEPDFLEAHRRRARAGGFLNGRRLMMPDDWRDLTPQQVEEGAHRGADVDPSRREIKRLWRKSVYYRLAPALFWHRLRLLGANTSMWRADFEAINGYDEGYIGWGTADEDFRRRLNDLGVRWGCVFFEANVWHIPHPPVPSKPAKVKQGRNIARYDTWTYLLRPVVGLRHRVPASLRLMAAGDTSQKVAGEHIEWSGGGVTLRPDAELLVLGLNEAALRPSRRSVAQMRVAMALPNVAAEHFGRLMTGWGEADLFLVAPGVASAADAARPFAPLVFESATMGALPPPEAAQTPVSYLKQHREALLEVVHGALRDGLG